MDVIRKYSINGLFYGFVFGFFACLIVMTSTNSVDEVPISHILATSGWVGVVTGIVCWLIFFLMIGGVASGEGGIGNPNSDGFGGSSGGGGDSGGGGGD